MLPLLADLMTSWSTEADELLNFRRESLPPTRLMPCLGGLSISELLLSIIPETNAFNFLLSPKSCPLVLNFMINTFKTVINNLAAKYYHYLLK